MLQISRCAIENKYGLVLPYLRFDRIKDIIIFTSCQNNMARLKIEAVPYFV